MATWDWLRAAEQKWTSERRGSEATGRRKRLPPGEATAKCGLTKECTEWNYTQQ
jgi:hypothetical protein